MVLDMTQLPLLEHVLSTVIMWTLESYCHWLLHHQRPCMLKAIVLAYHKRFRDSVLHCPTCSKAVHTREKFYMIAQVNHSIVQSPVAALHDKT